MRRTRTIASLAIAFAALTILSSRSTSQAQGSASAPTEVSIGVAAPVAILSLPQIATDQHLWPSSIHVTWTTILPATITSSLATGKIQFVVGTPPQYDIGAYNAKVPIEWLAQWQDPADFQMIVRPGIASLADLKGKAIATTSVGSTTALLAAVALQKAGLQLSDFKILPMGDVGSEIAAVATGAASSLVLPASSVQPLLARIPGSKVAYDFYEAKVPWIGAGIVAYQPWVAKNEAATIAVLSGLNKALALVHTNPDLAKPSVAKFVGADTQAVADLQFKFFSTRTPAALQPVNVHTFELIYQAVRATDNGAGPPDSFAKASVNNSYVEKMLAASR